MRDVELCKYPYPYSAMLAICSDLDETRGFDDYIETIRFLNSDRSTRAGAGVDLEVGNSIYFEMPQGEVAYDNMDEYQKEVVRKLIRSGHIDCIHSFGDLTDTRSRAAEIIQDLVRHECRLRVWVDHAVAPSNIGQDIMQGLGDDPGSPVFHTDLTTDYGIEFVWCGRVSSVFGQDGPTYFGFEAGRFVRAGSVIPLVKELAKKSLGMFPRNRYELHAKNRLLQPRRLKSGRTVHEFMRTNPSPGGVSSNETMLGLAESLHPTLLDHLYRSNKAAVIYTHLGKEVDDTGLVPDGTKQSLSDLANRYRRNEILVCTTFRLLRYVRSREALEWRARPTGNDRELEIACSSSVGGSLEGLTFRVHRKDIDRLFLRCGEKRAEMKLVGETATTSYFGIEWPRLTLPHDSELMAQALKGGQVA